MQKMESLALSFPSLRSAVGVRPWSADELDAWARSDVSGHGALCAARFMLAVWNPDGAWSCGRFDLMEALAVWDVDHRLAFLSWVGRPWWP
jgi:hypothetical protein